MTFGCDAFPDFEYTWFQTYQYMKVVKHAVD